jgi:hypothetical protein
MTGSSPITAPSSARDIVKLDDLIPFEKGPYLHPLAFSRLGETFPVGARSISNVNGLNVFGPRADLQGRGLI